MPQAGDYYTLNKKSPASTKGNVQQLCMFESPVRTKSKLTHPSNNVSFTLDRECQTARPLSLSRIGLKSPIFFPLSFSAFA